MGNAAIALAPGGAATVLDAIARARALRQLLRYQEGEAVLAPYRALAPSHLALAATLAQLAISRLGDSECAITAGPRLLESALRTTNGWTRGPA